MLTTKGVLKALRRPGRYLDAHGLVLKVVNPNNASWQFRFERDGRERWMGLGPVHTVSLAEARERARAARQALLDGVDPIEQKKQKKNAAQLAAAKAMIFRTAAEQYAVAHDRRWTNPKGAAQFASSLKQYAFPIIGELSVADIDTGLVLKVLEQRVDAAPNYPAGQFWEARPETANRVRRRIEAVLDWATARGYRSGDNPAAWKTIGKVLPSRDTIAKVVNHPALPFSQVSNFMAELRKCEGTPARALELLILTATRTGEALGATWDEVDLSAATWTIPAERMKAKKEHRVPLAPRVIALLSGLYREEGNPHIFIGTQGAGLGDKAMAKVLHRMGRDDIVVHGFRSTFRDWAAELTNTPNHVVELALAHAVGDKVEAAYRRGDLFDKRRKLMEAWARYCTTSPAGDVVPLRRVR